MIYNCKSQQGRGHRLTFNITLAVFWMLGLFLGVFFSLLTASGISNIIHCIAVESVSFFGLLAVNTQPLIICTVVLWFSKPFYVLPVIFLKAFTFSFCAQCVVLAYGSAGWLVCCLLMLSDSCSVFMMLLFCTQRQSKHNNLLLYNFVLYAVIIALITCIDFYVVHPFLVTLLK